MEPRLWPWLVALAVVLVVGGASRPYTVSLDRQVAVDRDKVKALDDQMVSIKGDLPRITMLRERGNYLETMTDVAKNVGERDLVLSQALMAIAKARPAAVTVSRLQLDDRTACVNVVAGAAAAGPLDDFQKALSLLPVCDRVLSNRLPVGPGVHLRIEIWCKRRLIPLDPAPQTP